MTISRPGGATVTVSAPKPPFPGDGGGDSVGDDRPLRRVPAWVMVLALVAAVALLAAINAEATRRDHHRARAAADRVDATLVVAGGVVHAGTFELTLQIANFAGDLQVRRLRLDPPAYGVVPPSRVVDVPAGASAEIAVRLRPRCPPVTEGSDPRVLLSVSPASGRARDIATSADARLLANLSRQACGLLTGAESAHLQVTGPVVSHRDYIEFAVEVRNRSARPFMVQDVTGPGLSVRVEGGVPAIVPARGGLQLPLRVWLRVSVPACAGLPPAAEPGVPVFGGFALELRDADGTLQSVPYIAAGRDPVYPALIGLRTRICPSGSYQLRPPG